MKTLLFSCLFLVSATYINAQPHVADNDMDGTIASSTPVNTYSPYKVNLHDIEMGRHSSLYKNTTVRVKNDEIVFYNLPKNEVFTAYITNTKGDIYLMEEVGMYHTAVDVRSIPHGLHYITIICDHKCRKSFLIHI